MKLVELPWGDLVNPEHVVGVSVERHGETLFVDVATDIEGLHYSSDAINKIGEAHVVRTKAAEIIVSGEVVAPEQPTVDIMTVLRQLDYASRMSNSHKEFGEMMIPVVTEARRIICSNGGEVVRRDE